MAAGKEAGTILPALVPGHFQYRHMMKKQAIEKDTGRLFDSFHPVCFALP